jgi:pimeloyl-ACP methyl ester carboxylesterase
LIIHRAAREDWTAFATAVLRAAISSHHAPAMGMYLTVSCSESVPLIGEDEIARETSGTFLGEHRIRTHQEACREWPRADIPADYFAPVNSLAPVLMLSGQLDSATPAHLGTEAAQALSNSHQILLPATAHEYTSACAGSIIVQFITTASTAGLNTGCVERLRRPAFPIELQARYLR